jgi:hypothetical protein
MDPSDITSPSASIVLELLTYYNLEADRYPKSTSKERILSRWMQIYPELWIKLALVESLYQGRYKMVSVEQLLILWSRRGQPTYHFNYEFESLVCHNVPHQMEQAVTFPRHTGNPQHTPKTPTPSQLHGAARFGSVQSEALPRTVSSLRPSSPSSELDEASDPQTLQSSQDVPNSGLKSVQHDSEKVLPDEAKLSELSTFGAYHLLPVTLNRLGQEPIQQFTPEATSIQFCERLEEIARSNS